MNGALLRKTARDSAIHLAVTLAAVVLFEVVFVAAINTFGPQLVRLWESLGFLRTMFQALFSIDLAAGVSMDALVTIGLTHPFLFAVTWAFLIATCTRTTVGEIDRGTADLLLTLPLSRTTVFITVSVFWLLTCLLMAAATWLGIAIGERVVDLPEPLSHGRLLLVSANYALLLAAIGAVSMLVSSCSQRRGWAVAVMIGLLLVSFVISFLEPFLHWVERIRFLGLMHYYRPVDCVREGSLPLGNTAALVLIAAAAWTAGLALFSRRDIPAS